MSVLVTTLSWRIGSRDEVLLLGEIERAQVFYLICSDISSPSGGFRWSEDCLVWLWRWILIPSSSILSCSLHSGPDPVALALGDYFLKVRHWKEAQVGMLPMKNPYF